MNEQQQQRFAAAEELSWGGLGKTIPTPKESSGLPAHWTDVTDIVLAALSEVRAAEEQNKKEPPQLPISSMSCDSKEHSKVNDPFRSVSTILTKVLLPRGRTRTSFSHQG